MKSILSVFLCLASYTAYSQSYLIFPDTRTLTTSPLDYGQQLVLNFKNRTTVNLPITSGEGNTGVTVPVIGLRGWRNDNTSGKAHELAFGDDNFFYVRSGWSTWETWRRFIIEDLNGNVGIGTLKPGSYKLAVNGSMHAKQINVDLNNWADYVFKEDYRLPDLKEIEIYVSNHHHLPEIPSETEVQEKGIDLGEMVRLQMKKIEELTLYLIQKDELDAQRKVNNDLEVRLSALENKQKQN